jgi:1-acyl-sn-glycerol-3-phosphate acyltransferase
LGGAVVVGAAVGSAAGAAAGGGGTVGAADAAWAPHEPPVTSQIAVCIPPPTAGATLGMATVAAPAKVTTPARTASHSTMVCPLSRMVQDHSSGARGAPWAAGLIFSVGRPTCRLGPTVRCSVPQVSEAPSDDVKIRAQVYKDPRPPEHFDRFHQRTRTRSPDIVYEIVRVATTLYSWILFRVRGIDPEHVPASGPVILAPNHSSFMDHFLIGASIRRKVQFMAKSQLFKPPMQFIYTHGGVFPVRRGHRDEETFVTALKVLDDGGCVAMYCEGGRSRTGRIGDVARPGIGRLALESGAMIVPVAVHGSSRVRNWRRLQFPTVTVQYGEPFRYERIEEPTRDQQQAVADEVLEEIRRLYEGLEAVGRPAALARARAERRARRAKRTAAA